MHIQESVTRTHRCFTRRLKRAGRLGFVASFVAFSLQSLASGAAAPSRSLVIPDGWAPAGWTVAPPEKVPRPDRGLAMVVQDGHRVAAIVATIVQDNRQRALPDELKEFIDEEVKRADERGLPSSVSPAVQDVWAGGPALREDVVLTRSDGKVRQRVLMTQAPGNVVCLLMYSADEANFDNHSAGLEQAAKGFRCR